MDTPDNNTTDTPATAPATSTALQKQPRYDFLPPDTTPEEWETYFIGLDNHQKHTVVMQDAFLHLYAEANSYRQATRALGVAYSMPYYWEHHGLHRFKERLVQAHLSFRERLQDTGLARIDKPEGNRGSDVLLMAMLNAHWPERYSRDRLVVVDTGLKDFLVELKKIGARSLAAIEGEGTVTDADPVQQLLDMAKGPAT